MCQSVIGDGWRRSGSRGKRWADRSFASCGSCASRYRPPGELPYRLGHCDATGKRIDVLGPYPDADSASVGQGAVACFKERLRRLSRLTPVVGCLLVVDVSHPSDQGMMALLPRPFDCFVLRFGGGKDVISMVLDDVTLDRRAFRPTLWAGLDVDVRHVSLLSVSNRNKNAGVVGPVPF
jgi:hypothetical protein